MPPKTAKLIQRIYDEVHAALWALLVAGVVVFALAVAPKLPEIRAQAERMRIQEIAAENRFYCEKWGMPADTPRHIQCTLDLNELRAKVARQMAYEEF
jgi:hypothetical protein